jgi:hypothetical protein
VKYIAVIAGPIANMTRHTFGMVNVTLADGRKPMNQYGALA